MSGSRSTMMSHTPFGRLRHNAESVAMQSSSAQIQNPRSNTATTPPDSKRIITHPHAVPRHPGCPRTDRRLRDLGHKVDELFDRAYERLLEVAPRLHARENVSPERAPGLPAPSASLARCTSRPPG